MQQVHPVSRLWASGSRDAVSRHQGHLESYSAGSFPLELECFPGSQALSKQLMAFEGHNSHKAQGSYTQVLGDYLFTLPILFYLRQVLIM